ncbi:MAG: hypothetical protein IPH50_07805 [Rhodanobacteraceae bacterium]|nr:hypothetical protein [Rhodanobacteraceae bacterium]
MILGGSFLRSSDGTAAGTTDLTTQGAVSARRGVELDGVYYLNAALGGLNSELWRTDGTQAGTYVVRELVDYGFAGLAGDPVVFDGKLALFREQYSSFLASTLHESDGTFEGTKNSSSVMRRSSSIVERARHPTRFPSATSSTSWLRQAGHRGLPRLGGFGWRACCKAAFDAIDGCRADPSDCIHQRPNPGEHFDRVDNCSCTALSFRCSPMTSIVAELSAISVCADLLFASAEHRQEEGLRVMQN